MFKENKIIERVVKKIKADKSYGQNFLIDKNVLQKIVTAGDLTSSDCVLEIGAGQGILTEELLKLAGEVITFEIDQRFIKELQQKFSQQKKLIIKNLDILNFDLNELSCLDYKIVANIPYNITSKILEKFLNAIHKPQLMVLLVQKEVAERICAAKGEKSFLSIMVQYFGKPQIVQIVKPNAFNPSPKVDSAILKISDIASLLPLEKEKLFFRLVKAGFSQKRKILKKNLKSILAEDRIIKAFQLIGLKETVRAEELSLKQWLNLAENFI